MLKFRRNRIYWMYAAYCPTGLYYRGADKSLVRPGKKKATATEDFDFHISYLLSSLEE